jgi:transposase
MMIKLTPEEIQILKLNHRRERDGRVRDRIKAVVHHNSGWSNEEIAEALLLHIDTITDHLKDYAESKKLKPENGGSTSHLNASQTIELIEHIESHTYTNVSDICAYIKITYSISFTSPGLTKWLHRNRFSYKQPKGTPAKADPEKQKQFIDYYEKLQTETYDNEPILFGDGVHPTMATKISYGWIRTGKDKLIKTSASRTRVNIFGSLNLEDMSLVSTAHETIDSSAMEVHFKKMREQYPQASRIHLIVDQGSYNKSKETRASADKYKITLHYLPPYSPNLNPIERLWKVMNEQIRNNRFFASAKEFRDSIDNFLKVEWSNISQSMVDRINDNFSVIKTVSSS